ncbi:MotA/TolQ/ExbB proton channel family protein [Endozoicomonas ascidiicola]|uniref:MotA/TolQ/ExbB proton channel family protein n=1 Tax=Endozoicomonas ascidiicola TaxID=1698521 RepID=UPI00082AD890|nr:MotA/TolQ/ExbB proton channel family protein [Endozoicomonas ascidiicola]
MLTENFTSLGVMAWPLLITSCLGLAMILERLVTYAMLPSLNRKGLTEIFNDVRQCCGCGKNDSKSALCQSMCKGKGIRQGIAVLLSHSGGNKAMREEVAGLWLLKQKRSLNAWLKPLMLIGTLAPMLGLLGTVLGMIDMFQDIAAIAGPVTPDVLAAGLWQAMFTTAYGLIIAIPALAAAHGFGVWANHYLAKLEFALNHINLLLEGVTMNDDGMATTSATESSAVNSVKKHSVNNGCSSTPDTNMMDAGAVAA